MFSRVVASVLRSLVGDYVEGINRENLNLGLRKGDVTLKNLKIKTSALDSLDSPFSVKAGTVGTLRAKVPWTHLTSKPVTLALEDVVITVGKDALNELVALERINKSRATSLRALDDVIVQAEDLMSDDDEEEDSDVGSDQKDDESQDQDNQKQNKTASSSSKKKKKKQRLKRSNSSVGKSTTPNKKDSTKPSGKDTKTKDRILNNLILDIKNLEIKYEDMNETTMFTCGIKIEQVTLHTTDSSWTRQHYSKAKYSKIIYRLAAITNFQIYWEEIIHKESSRVTSSSTCSSSTTTKKRVSIIEPVVFFLRLKFATAICPLRTLVKLFLILLLELSKEIVLVTAVVP